MPRAEKIVNDWCVCRGLCKGGWSESKRKLRWRRRRRIAKYAVCRLFEFYALDEFGFVICNEYEGWFVSLWRNETRKTLCALWLSSLQGGLLCILTLKELADEPNIVVTETKRCRSTCTMIWYNRRAPCINSRLRIWSSRSTDLLRGKTTRRKITK